MPEYLDLLATHGLDSIVIDFKTDHGRLSYDTELALPRAMGAAPGPIKLDRLIADAHAAGIYVIARLVVFKDPFLFDWDNHRLAIWDSEQAGPWRHLVPAGDDSGDQVQREHWVDPFAPEVWQYNVSVAEELAARGVDEIQFDYIRFPSDGPTERATYRHRRPGMRRVDAIESFLALARERVEVPISTDLFGFNSWYRAGNFIGQDIEVLSEYVDVISPMFYPSHFPNHFLDDRGYTERAYAIYEAGVRRAQRMVRGAGVHPALRTGVPDRQRVAHGGRGVQPLPDAPARRQPGGGRFRVHPLERVEQVLYGHRAVATVLRHPRGGDTMTQRTVGALPGWARIAVLLGGAWLLASCASSPDDLAGRITAAEYFQHAQEATAASDYLRAMAWYDAFREHYAANPTPGEQNLLLWAEYEVAFLHHKMGDDRTAVRLLGELIDRYEAPEAANYAPAPAHPRAARYRGTAARRRRRIIAAEAPALRTPLTGV